MRNRSHSRHIAGVQYGDKIKQKIDKIASKNTNAKDVKSSLEN